MLTKRLTFILLSIIYVFLNLLQLERDSLLLSEEAGQTVILHFQEICLFTLSHLRRLRDIYVYALDIE